MAFSDNTKARLEVALRQIVETYQDAAKERLREALQPAFEQVLEEAFKDLQFRCTAMYEPHMMEQRMVLELLDKRTRE